jgi:hypothetical protein
MLTAERRLCPTISCHLLVAHSYLPPDAAFLDHILDHLARMC